MDTGKLLKIISDIQKEEEKGKIQTRLQNIATYYEQSNVEAINQEKDEIKRVVTTSRLSHYALSDYHAVQMIKVTDFAGPGLYQKLHQILNSQAHEVKQLLNEFINARSATIQSLSQLKNSLTDFGFESRALDDQNYEIGFVLPESHSDLEKTENVLEDFRLFLNALANAVNEPQPLKIKYVSNGSIEIFIDAGIKLAEHFDIVIDYILKIYGLMKLFDDLNNKYTEVYSKDSKAQAKKINDEQKKEKVGELLEELMKKLNLKTHDDRSRVKGHFKNILEHIESGVSAEVHTPEIEAPKEPSSEATPEEQKEFRKMKELYNKKHEIDQRNRDIFMLQQNNFYGMSTKFLNGPDKKKDKK